MSNYLDHHSNKSEYKFPGKNVQCFYDIDMNNFHEIFHKSNTVFITDENLYNIYAEKLEGFYVIKIEPGEKVKQSETVNNIIDVLLDFNLGKNGWVVGLGGGVVSDIAGFVAATYKRGCNLALVPTSLLAMVDASLGGKNGIDVGLYKNMVGTIYQPSYILFDYNFLITLPFKEWTNGFAEIIKHACIADTQMFAFLEGHNIHQIQKDKAIVAGLVERNVHIKMEIAVQDEFDKKDRQFLNFGHTLGHAIENLYNIAHGHAISIGMVAACALSEKLMGLSFDESARVAKLLAQYQLPVDLEANYEKIFEIIKKDKKREDSDINYVFLNSLGSPVTQKIPMELLRENLENIV